MTNLADAPEDRLEEIKHFTRLIDFGWSDIEWLISRLEKARAIAAKLPHDTSHGPHIGYQITYCWRCRFDEALRGNDEL